MDKKEHVTWAQAMMSEGYKSFWWTPALCAAAGCKQQCEDACMYNV